MSRFIRGSFDPETFEKQFDPMLSDRKARRKRKPKVHHHAKKTRDDLLQEIADLDGVEGGFKPTYTPSRHESGWLLQSLEGFYDQALINDVLALIKGGKEASVYRCAAHESMPSRLVAAKVYRPRMFRQLRNDSLYREGRVLLTEHGRAAKATDDRLMRAVGKKTAFGQQVAHTSWLMYEYNTLKALAKAGAAVPEPFAASDNAILMGYRGDSRTAAPPLSEVTLEQDEVEPLFDEVMRNIELMLKLGLIHGDLSAYNVLYWQGEITLIDFPQVTNLYTNPNAAPILSRDVHRICEYFARQGLRRNADIIVADLWDRYAQVEPDWQEAEES